MFPVIKRFMFSTRRAVWLCQEPKMMFVITRAQSLSEHLTQNPVLKLFLFINMITKCHNKCVVSLIDVYSVHSRQGTEGTYLNVHGDGYQSNNQLYDECCLSASPSSILSCGSLRGSTGGVVHTAVRVKHCDHTTHNPCPLNLRKQTEEDFPRNVPLMKALQFFCEEIHINGFLHLG